MLKLKLKLVKELLPRVCQGTPRDVHKASTRSLNAWSRGLSTTTQARPEPQVVDSMLQIGTRSIFDTEHDQYRELCRNFYAEKVTPFHNSWEEVGEVPRQLWKDAGSNGMLCVTMPEKYGGAGLDVVFAAVNWEEQSYANASGPGWPLHSEIVAPYLLHYGSEEQKMKYLPKMASGECITAIAMTEPGAGSDLQGMRTTAVKDGDHYIINGSKIYITNGWHSDMCIVCAKTDANAKGSKGISLFLVDASIPGFKKGRKLKKLGHKAADTAELFFEDVRVHKSALLGKEGQGFPYLMTELPQVCNYPSSTLYNILHITLHLTDGNATQERLSIAVSAAANAEACFEWTRTFVKERKAFGSSIASLQVVKHKLATLK
jgi:long-chain-acyl-CoA dehydrogenase